MKTKTSKFSASLALAAGMLAGLSGANAATIVSASFNGLTPTTAAVSTTGLLDWGFVSANPTANNGLFHNNSTTAYTNTPFGSLTSTADAIITTVSPSSAIGTVTLTENRIELAGQAALSNVTFGGVDAFGSYGGMPGTSDAWTMTFNDLGIGTFEIALYLGHTANDRNFRMNAVLSDGLTNPSLQVDSGAISGLGSTVFANPTAGSAFTYNIRVTTTSATDDLSLTFSSLSGGAGTGFLMGYTVIPEPSTALLGGLGVLALLRRRR